MYKWCPSKEGIQGYQKKYREIKSFDDIGSLSNYFLAF